MAARTVLFAAAWAVLAGVASGAGAAAGGKAPNVVYIMADDLNADWKSDRLSYMPNLKKYIVDRGVYFDQHVAPVPVCGPSRSSMLLGRYPHNHHYKMNGDLDSVAAFVARANNTVGKWLSDAGYYTAFLGKYVNSCEGHVPHGWSHWGGFIQTYDFYNASMYDMTWPDAPGSPDPPVATRVMTGVHQGDFMGNFTLDQVDQAAQRSKPFFVSVTPVMPHWGTCYGPQPMGDYAPTDPFFEFNLVDPATGQHYSMPTSPCPSVRHQHAFDGQTAKHIEGVWNVSITGLRPEFMKKAFEVPGRLNSYQAGREDIGFRNRSASLLDLDHMIGVIFAGLEERGLIESTFVFFTSDNGYHLGEHKMPFGKGEPYETDIRLPMAVTGPGIPKGQRFQHPTTHIDITKTIVELARAEAHAPTDLDGLSFAQELLGGRPDPEAWRTFSFSEFFDDTNTWQNVRVTNSTHLFTFHQWCTNDTEVFNLQDDPWQKANLAGSPGFAHTVEAQFAPLAVALGSCVAAQCSQPAPAAPAPLPCYPVYSAKTERIGSFNVLLAPNRSKIVGIHGWSVDFSVKDKAGVRGVPPSTVRVRLDGKVDLKAAPDQVANIPRPDILNHTAAPNSQHGFQYVFPGGFLPPQGKHALTVHVVTAGGKEVPLAFQEPPRCFLNGLPSAC